MPPLITFLNFFWVCIIINLRKGFKFFNQLRCVLKKAHIKKLIFLWMNLGCFWHIQMKFNHGFRVKFNFSRSKIFCSSFSCLGKPEERKYSYNEKFQKCWKFPSNIQSWFFFFEDREFSNRHYILKSYNACEEIVLCWILSLSFPPCSS
jgi:hypothetical protein